MDGQWFAGDFWDVAESLFCLARFMYFFRFSEDLSKILGFETLGYRDG